MRPDSQSLAIQVMYAQAMVGEYPDMIFEVSHSVDDHGKELVGNFPGIDAA